MNRCTVCVMPDTRPDTPFIDGVCAACVNHAARPEIDWDARKSDLMALLDRHDGRCVVPSSGGKDSTYQVMTLLSLGADVTVVTATTCHLTPVGRLNIDNLARYARTIEVTPNMTVRAKLNRIGLETVGDISWPEHVSIFTTPFKVAARMNASLMFYGENPQNQYGGPQGSEQAKTMTRRWVSEFGGFLGLRPGDLVGTDGLTARDMADYTLDGVDTSGIEAHFLGQYLPWDSHRNAEVALKAGMKQPGPPSVANWWPHENWDNAQTGVHDFFMFRKFGYGRGCAQISVDVRNGLVSRDEALRWVRNHEGSPPYSYAGVLMPEILDRLGIDDGRFWTIAQRFTSSELFDGSGPVAMLREFMC